MTDFTYTKTYTQGPLAGCEVKETTPFPDAMMFFEWAWDKNQKWGEGESDYKVSFTLKFG